MMQKLGSTSQLDQYGDSDSELETFSIDASSMQTASDNPGAGRTLGTLYSSLGKPVERALNSMAERLGLGPCATVVRIRGIRPLQKRVSSVDQHRTSLVAEPELSRNERQQLKKYCRRLVRYSRYVRAAFTFS